MDPFQALATLVVLAAKARRTTLPPRADEQLQGLLLGLEEAYGLEPRYTVSQLAKAWDAACEADVWTERAFMSRAIAYAALALGLEDEIELSASPAV